MSAQEHLESAFGWADRKHYEWQTQHAVVARHERELVRAAFEPLVGRVLDLGCGEGATLYHLGGPKNAVGVDLFEEKIEFARKALPQCTFVVASADRLPFEDQSFDHVLVRDVIHHLEQPSKTLDEIARVLRPGGRLDVLEPCRYNPLVALHAITNPAERGELRSSMSFLKKIISQRFAIEKAEHFQPLAIHRVVFHPGFGKPSLASNRLVCGAVEKIEQWAGRLFPKAGWTYLHVRATRR